MDKTQERIKADAEAYVQRTRGQQGRVETYIAGATAEQQRAQVLVDALEKINSQHRGSPSKGEMLIIAHEALEQWKGKEVEPTPQQTEPQPDLGTCVECKTRPATTDYNGHQHYVCKLCDDSLDREFDEEYR